MSKAKILIQLDSDPQPSVFDSVVAIDSGVDQLFRHGGVELNQVQGLVHGAMFTRGPQDLKSSAVFVGGSNVQQGEEMLRAVTGSFFGPVRVSVMMDSNGSNTTAAAAVVAAGRHLDLNATTALVLGSTGPVGQRVVRLLASAGSTVKAASRSLDRSQSVVQAVSEAREGAKLEAVEIRDEAALATALDGIDLVVAAGAAGVELLSDDQRRNSEVKVAIDLNAVPPVGIGAVDVMDSAAEKNGQIVYGAIGVGGTKMKIHKAALHRLFESNEAVLDADEIYAIGLELESST